MRDPSARTWIDEPADPGVGDHEVAPPPEQRVAGSRAPARTARAPRSSNALWATANRSAGPPTRIVVNRAERLVARRLDADPALDVRARRRGRRTARRRPGHGRRGHGRGPGRASISAAIGQRLAARATASTRSATASAALGPREVARGGGHRRVRATGRRAARRPRPGASRVERPRPRPGSRRRPRRTPRRCAAGGRPRAGTGRSPSAARTRPPRRASTRRPARRRGPRRRARRSSRRRGGTRAAGTGRAASAGSVSRAASAAAYPSSPVTWTTRTRSTSRGSAAGDRVVDPAHGLRAAEHQQDPLARPAAEPLARLVGVDPAERPDRRARSRTCAAWPSAVAGRRVAHREHGRQPRDEPDAPARDDVALPQHARDPQHGRGEQHRDRDVAAGGEDRRGRAGAAGARTPAGPTGRAGSGRATRWMSRAAERSERSEQPPAAGCPAAGTIVRSSPRCPPSQASSGAPARARSDRATARAG